MLRSLVAPLVASTVALAPAVLGAETGWRTLGLGRIVMDVPSDWAARRDRQGWTIVEPRQGRWTLRVESDEVAAVGPRVPLIESLTRRTRSRLLDELGGTVEVSDFDVAEKLLVHDYAVQEGGVRFLARAWHRIALCDTAVVLARFTFMVREALAEDPAIRAALTLAESRAAGAELNPAARPYRPSGASAP